ncbi:2,3-epoxybenzoyl-CoA dihydrolase [Streptomyces europaeiscabiei]|uniref:2,3-epoxybenzoyl-CoA dihydrolase n=1 Tax=Streptomyces europaeiscabiei TaxID=146819 RepID=UPI0029A57900|nr:2,3-epoxybenzoyl-CoA dihydrolase [Streptomyces europaeiscabiei]MDX3587665.1 2,3-epoxybenzoyl-CoA dihydrolase [Streptomyces europaeiscabiei]MDX3616690.1 2,3-epoxybenzoyl-CoA dihydrolase [Streptomyces europaeiscabiei]WUD34308.1 2,3-epoxybenzoyl-CoA dihydrolase [Streptomyces europaeiscabiei]
MVVASNPDAAQAAQGTPEAAAPVVVSFDRSPDAYRHWRLSTDGPVAWLEMDVDEQGGLVPGYELKLNSYDLGVDIELYDALQRLRFEHPEVRSVVLTSAKEKVFCAGANIRMLAASSHQWKVNFCKFTNETRNSMEDASEHSGLTFIAAVNGSCAGGGYELALACDKILLIDDNSSAVALPEVPLLGVLPGTGGLTRVTDKRRVRKDLADLFATRSDGVRGKTAVDWRLVDEVVPRRDFRTIVEQRAVEAAESSSRPADARGVALTPLEREVTEDGITYRHVRAEYDRSLGLVSITVKGPGEDAPADAAALHAQGADGWLLALTRELDDLILLLRTNETELGTWVLRTEGDPTLVLAHERAVLDAADDGDWLAGEITHYYKRTLKRLDVTSRSLIALIEPGSCFAGLLLELAVACDLQYMLDGPPIEDPDSDDRALLTLSEANFGAFPMGNGLTRLQSRFYQEDDHIDWLRRESGQPVSPAQARELGLVTDAPDDIDWEDEIRIVLESRAALSPDALTGMEANHRFVGPETIETKIFGRLTAWQNWIFIRPNASGPEGALRRYGTGQKAVYDRKRV